MIYLLSPGWSPKQVINFWFEWARVTCSDRYIFCYYKYVACPVLGDFGAILAVAVSDLLASLVLLFHHPRKGGENDTFLICCDGSFLFCRAGAWHSSDHLLWAQQSPSAGSREQCSVEKNPAFPAAAAAAFHVSWIYVTEIYMQNGLEVILRYSGKTHLPKYTFKIGEGAAGISFVFVCLNTWRSWIWLNRFSL